MPIPQGPCVVGQPHDPCVAIGLAMPSLSSCPSPYPYPHGQGQRCACVHTCVCDVGGGGGGVQVEQEETLLSSSQDLTTLSPAPLTSPLLPLGPPLFFLHTTCSSLRTLALAAPPPLDQVSSARSILCIPRVSVTMWILTQKVWGGPDGTDAAGPRNTLGVTRPLISPRLDPSVAFKCLLYRDVPLATFPTAFPASAQAVRHIGRY